MPFTLLQLHEHTQISILQIRMSPFHQIHFLSHIPQPHIPLITNIPHSHIQHLPSPQPIPKPKFQITTPLKTNPIFI
ncbi:Mur ligase family protein, partial [Staphylococcus epidermidis]|uniref:Mur ligase family protein n=1 Tax=Staphylococcus epidermidis TaxID=1282 RepID=UPI0021B2919E